MPGVFLKAAAAERWHPHVVLLLILVFGLIIILIMARICLIDYLQSYSTFVDTRYSLKCKRLTPE